MADISVTAASVVATGATQTETGKLGATVTAGQVVYKDPADGLLKLSDNDNASAAIRAAYGIALNGGATGQPATIARKGPVTFNAALTKGMVYCVSGTPGAICPLADVTTGDDTIILGVATSTTVLYLGVVDPNITL